MRPQEDFTIAPDSAALNENDTLVLDDDDSNVEEKISVHVHFAHSQPLQSMHHTGSPMPEHLHPDRSKRGSSFPSHALDSTRTVRDSADSSQAISWSHHATPKQHSFMLSHDQGGSDSLYASGQETITWSLTSQEHGPSSHATAQRLDTDRAAIRTERSRSPNRGSRASSTSTSSERRQAHSATRYLAAHGYQPHTLEEFRTQGYDAKRERYWTLGTLGADVDTVELQRKREKAERMKHLSQTIREQNQAMADSSSSRQSQSTKASASQHSPASTQERMQEYARSVQRAATHNRPPSPKRPRGAQRKATDKSLGASRDQMCPLEALVDLEELHAQQKQQVEAMRRQLEDSLEGLGILTV